jgi:hypothetical protein
MSNMEAPVVPMTLAKAEPIRRKITFLQGVASPLTRM